MAVLIFRIGCTRAVRHANIPTTGDVYAQTIEKSMLNATNSRTVEILTEWEASILSGVKVVLINLGTPKRRSLRTMKEQDQLGPKGREAGCKCLILWWTR